MNGISPEIWYLSDPAQGLCMLEGNTGCSATGELQTETRTSAAHSHYTSSQSGNQ